MIHELTKEQRDRVAEAKNELQRKVQQMISSGRHDVAAVRFAISELLEKLR